MKAVIITKPGNASALEIQDIDETITPEGYVKIKNKAFGLNRAEIYYRSGNYGEITEPRIPGIEAVGEICEDASGVYTVGQKVMTAMGGLMLARHGSYAEYVLAPINNVLAVNSNLPWEQLAAIPQAYLTVWAALDKNLAIEKDQTLLIRGGTTTIGLAAITYAKARGLHVIATTRSKDNKALLVSKGADEVIIDDGAIAETIRQHHPEGIDCALDIVGVGTIKDTSKTIKHWGRVCVVGILSGMPVLENFGLSSDLPNTVSISFFASGLFGSAELPLAESPIQWIIDQIEDNKIPSLVSRVYDFDQIQEAHKIIESDKALGKVVIKM